MQCGKDMPLQQLRAMAQHCQRGDGAQAASLEVDRRAVVDLPVDYLVHHLHNFGGKLRHGGRLTRISFPAIISEPEFLRRPAQVFGAAFKRQREPRR